MSPRRSVLSEGIFMKRTEPLKKKKIIVIDDEGDLLKMVGMRLESSGYDVKTLDSGERAVEVIREIKPDLVLLDVLMPGKNGCQVCIEIKADEVLKKIPVIIFTAHYPEEEYLKAHAEEMGADDYMLKPFEAQELLAKIKYLIK